MKSIPLHKEHGLNPTISICFYCGKEKNEIALLGRYCKEKAPMKSVVDYEPCSECKKLMEKGFMLIEAKDGCDQKNPFRTGYVTVISLEAAKQVFEGIDFDKQRWSFIEESVLKQIMGEMYHKRCDK